METDDATVKNEPSSQSSTVSSTPVPPQSSSSNLDKPAQGQAATTAPTKVKLPSIVLPEVDLYLHLLVLLFAIDKQKYKQVKYSLF
jgi:hypothetical protein